MKTIGAFFFFFFLCVCMQALSQKADSLEAILRKTTADSTKTLLLSQLADELTKSNPVDAADRAKQGLLLATQIHFEKGMFENYTSLASVFQGRALFDSAVFYYHQAFSIATKSKDIIRQAEVSSGLGHSFMRKSMMDSSRFYLEKGLALAKQVNATKIEAGIYNNYGNVFLEESSYQKALDYFVLAAKLYEILKDDRAQCPALSNIGNIEYRLGNLDRALEYAHQSMAIAKRTGLTSSIGYAHKLLGRIYKKQEKYDQALAEYKEGQKVYLQLGDPRSAAELLQNIGNVYFDKEQFRDALVNYQQSLELGKKISSKLLMAFAYSAIGQAYMALKRNPEALVYLDSSRTAARAIGNRYLIMDNYSAASSIYESQGDFKRALLMHQQFVQVKDSITKSENRQMAEETMAKYDVEKKEVKIALLEKDQELKALAMERQRAIQAGSAIALLLVIIIAFLLVNRYRVINRSKRQAEIEQVRNTIARDLHDDIGSTLSTINIISNLAMRENVNGNNLHLSRIAEQSSRMMESMTDMVWSINPINDSIEKMAVKMKVFASEILEPQNIGYLFSGEESLSGFSLGAEKRKNFFLLFKEAINNAAKYSGATEVGIIFRKSEEKLTMIISDNGHGFDDKKVGKGNGLKNMEGRAQAMQGDFKLSSVIGLGTRIELELSIT